MARPGENVPSIVPPEGPSGVMHVSRSGKKPVSLTFDMDMLNVYLIDAVLDYDRYVCRYLLGC